MREIKTVLDILKAHAVRVQVVDVIDSVKKLSTLVSTFTKAQDEANAEW